MPFIWLEITGKIFMIPVQLKDYLKAIRSFIEKIVPFHSTTMFVSVLSTPGTA